MPDIGMIELMLIGLIGFLVLGPERLPEFLGQVGKVVRQGRAWMMSLKMQLEQEKAQLGTPIKDITQEVQSSIAHADDKASLEKKE
jgi:sec-independent protein translocase protein TatB